MPKNETLSVIDELVESGVLGSEQCPESSFWRWPVLKPDLLPAWFRSNYINYGEIRYYWS